MKSKVLAVQCFVKYDTLSIVLQQLSKCIDRENYVLVFGLDSCIDMPYQNREHWRTNNAKVHNLILEYQKSKIYKEIIILQNQKNLGCFKTCQKLIDYCMNITDYVIFLEDDVVLSKDGLLWYEYAYMLSKEEEKLFAISSAPITGLSSNSDKDLYKMQKCDWIGSCEFGMSKSIWDKYGHLRGQAVAGDVEFGFACRNSNMYTVCPLVSRMFRLGVYHPDSYSTYYHNKAVIQPDRYLPVADSFVIDYNNNKLSYV